MAIGLTRLEVREVRIPFRFGFRHAGAERKVARSLILAVHTDTGHVGYGEVLPRRELTGETVESAWKDVGELWWSGVRRLDFGEEELPPVKMAPVHQLADAIRKNASYGGLDIAVTDAWARATGRSCADLFGTPAGSVFLTAPLGAGSVSDTRRVARIFTWLGFHHFKMKAGFENDLDRAEAVRKMIGPDRDLRVDANGAWHPNQAIRMARALGKLDVTCIEQPIAAGDAQALAHVRETEGVPVMADESVCTLDDAQALLKARAADFWNVRLAKVGGFAGMRALTDLARAHGVGLHLGVLVGETSLLAAAQRACLGMGPFRYVEYGFPRVLLKGDPFRGGPGGYRGVGRPLSDRPGLGVRVVPERLDRVTVRQAEYT